MPAPHLGYLPVWRLSRPAYNGHDPAWWCLGCHGGAGSTTLASALGAGDAGRYWPAPDPPAQARVVLVARTSASALRAAQGAARQWASGALPPTIHLLGLVVIADAPGRLPRPLRELLHLISGGVPKVWELPWVEALRLGDPPSQIQLPAPFTTLAADLHRMVTGGIHA